MIPTRRFLLPVCLIAAALILFAEPALAAPVDQEPPLAPDTLANLDYTVSAGSGEPVVLTDGEFADDASHVYVSLLAEYTLWGDLHGDGDTDAVVFTVSNGGGSGNFWDMHAVLDEEGVATPVSSIFVGDRIQIESGAIEDDGAIVLKVVTAGPTDALCCPTQHEERVYRLVEGVLVLEEQTVLESTQTAAVETQSTLTTTNQLSETLDSTLAAWSPDAEPRTATLNLGGGAGMWLDPMLISVFAGAPLSNQRVNGASLGEGCTGTLPVIPDVVVNWTEDPNVETLRFFTLGQGDSTLAVVAPNGDVLCNDDFSALVLDAAIEIENPAEGRYAIYVGSAANRIASPAFLVATASSLTPATFRLASLLPNHVGNGPIIPARAPVDTLLAEGGSQSIALSPAELPFTTTLSAGGEVAAFDVELGNELCTGFVTVEPTLRFAWQGNDGEELAVYFEAKDDTTLIIRDSNGSFLCSDDADGADNLNPLLVLPTLAGEYAVWVGDFSPEVETEGILTISADSSAGPTPLTMESEE